MPFIPHTESEVRQMLDSIGVNSIAQLFEEIPANLHAKDLGDMPEALDEMQINRLMAERANLDNGVLNFIGAGAYEHHIPAAVWQLVSRGEFYTAYTPYQAEASQGTLQVIYEYQTMISDLTGMDASNASLYDGASALAEAVLMAIRSNRKSKSRKILLPTTVNPLYRDTAHSIVTNQNIELVELPFASDSGTLDPKTLEQYQGQDFAALVIQQPNYFGNLEDVHTLTDWAHANNMLVIAVANPLSLTLLAPAGEWGQKGADIACGDGQPLGAPLSSGGPYYGYMCTKMEHLRQMPGRIIGKTEDVNGKPGYTLTLQAREQHIRRSKATSNICTNQGLLVTASTIHMAIMGLEGLTRQAELSHQNTNYMREQLCKIAGVSAVFSGSTFHEVAIKLPKNASEVLDTLAAQNIAAGVLLEPDYPALKDCILLCATETKTLADIDHLASALQAALGK